MFKVIKWSYKLSNSSRDCIRNGNTETIRDAIDVTRHLGLQDLWVDSVSFIQDDEGDEDEEIARMLQIYQNATIIISAAKASHCDERFLPKRELMTAYGDFYELSWLLTARASSREGVLL
ncbi:hypothetical protein B0J13DRAFT_533676 [Dactylonectria estremocensis]|uniref:Heterokaryon incompatibility domain-containing protein n=1 Tax=Dactylonectria estremocensis TaxID=1079267 RepID=A0A9P9D7J9_9HYPO|nr:hypothetical protein B0J13DRAFT_533676 [Dactylonectria estremocensis]